MPTQYALERQYILGSLIKDSNSPRLMHSFLANWRLHYSAWAEAPHWRVYPGNEPFSNCYPALLVTCRSGQWDGAKQRQVKRKEWGSFWVPPGPREHLWAHQGAYGHSTCPGVTGTEGHLTCAEDCDNAPSIAALLKAEEVCLCCESGPWLGSWKDRDMGRSRQTTATCAPNISRWRFWIREKETVRKR